MTEETASTKTVNPYPGWWIAATFVLTPLTAVLLAHLGYIPLDTISALVDGFIVALVYVGFRLGYRRWELKTKTKIDSIA